MTLSIYEVLVTIDEQAALNRQVDNFINTHKLFARSNHTYNDHTFVVVQTGRGISIDANLIC